MDYLKCDSCGNEFLRDQLTAVEGGWLCRACAAAQAANEPEAPVDGVGDEAEGAGAAATGEAFVKAAPRRPIPGWIKAAALLLAALAVFGVYRGLRLVRARGEIAEAERLFFKENNAAGALAAARRAREIAPGSAEIGGFYNYFAGVEALYREDNEKAVACLEAIQAPMSENPWALGFLRTRARMNLAFDRKQFEEALGLARQMLAAAPDNPMLLAQAASACAACYAQRGDEKLKQEALELMRQAGESAAQAPPEDQGRLNELKARLEYEARRIRHRLETRQILSRKEYERQFGAPDKEQKAAQTQGQEKK